MQVQVWEGVEAKPLGQNPWSSQRASKHRRRQGSGGEGSLVKSNPGLKWAAEMAVSFSSYAGGTKETLGAGRSLRLPLDRVKGCKYPKFQAATAKQHGFSLTLQHWYHKNAASAWSFVFWSGSWGYGLCLHGYLAFYLLPISPTYFLALLGEGGS